MLFGCEKQALRFAQDDNSHHVTRQERRGNRSRRLFVLRKALGGFEEFVYAGSVWRGFPSKLE
jgi:hypothetical protein